MESMDEAEDELTCRSLGRERFVIFGTEPFGANMGRIALIGVLYWYGNGALHVVVA